MEGCGGGGGGGCACILLQSVRVCTYQQIKGTKLTIK